MKASDKQRCAILLRLCELSVERLARGDFRGADAFADAAFAIRADAEFVDREQMVPEHRAEPGR